MKKILYILLFFAFTVLPTFSEIDGNLAMEAMQAKQEGDLTKQHIVAQKIITKNPEDPFGYDLEAEYLFKSEKYKNAMEYYTKAINAVKIVKKQDAVKLKKMGYKENDILEILNFDSSLAEYYIYRGICFFELNELSKALNDFLNAEKFSDEKYYDITMMKVICLINIARYEDALKNLDVARELAKNQEDLETIERYSKVIKIKQNNN